ncbi:hypothetical protein Cni_G01049 [Canna indica]|uniref:U-box domain-containing protein n=1 Tax=Canna indica TaxID=4628 RepID=A0AAQ3JM12_9LILI|nr:hypothetical protein Cni_G01049 [Canna indica]
MEMMVVESLPEFRPHIGRSYSDSVFRDCNSNRSGQFPIAGSETCGSSSLRRFLVHSSTEYPEDMVQGLISDLNSSSIESQLRAAMELRLLAKHCPENRLRIARAGAVGPLVALLSHTDPQLQEQGVTAIFNLSLCEENKAIIAAAGAVHHLVNALSFGTPAARENAAGTLLRLAELEDLRATIGRSGAIPALVSLLETGGTRGKKDAATALFTLFANKENRARAVEAGVVRPLLDLMADPESEMVDKAAYVLHRVLTVPEGRTATVEESGLPVLVEMVEVGSRRQKEVAMLSLLEICEENVAYRRMVVREGAIPPVVALAQSSSRTTKEKAEALIAFLRQPTTARH